MKYACLLVASCLWVLSVLGKNPNVEEKIRAFVDKINTFNNLFPQEKVYLHFDNTGYFKGETIWFKAYVVRTDSMRPTGLSGVLYVELLNPYGDILETRKLKIEKGQAYGDIKLDKPMSSGFYEIRAYTRYMTNWDKEGTFSRVFPIFLTPTKTGNYDDMRINRDEVLLRLPGYEDLMAEKKNEELIHVELNKDGTVKEQSLKSSERNMKKLLRMNKQLDVRFFPEGGSLVNGLQSRVAFEIQEGDSVRDTAEAYLMTARGDTLSIVRTLREGRGFFTCQPDLGSLYLGVSSKKKLELFALPKATNHGCVLTLNTLPTEHIVLQVTGSSLFENEVLGLSLQNNGQVYYFDTLTIRERSVLMKFSRVALPPGVSRITLFTHEGRILSERLFFIAPRGEETQQISIKSTNKSVLPHQKLAAEVEAVPDMTFSLSVMDADTRTNGSNLQNIASYMLISSDLKGYIRNPDYYLEKDDPEHRAAADLLTLIQGWRRYDWKMMTGQEPFVKKQPIEDGLYIDGRLKAKKKTDVVSNVDIKATLYRESYSQQGTTRTDSMGNYAFDLPDCGGEWTLLLSTSKEGDAQNYIISIDRQFSPENRLLSFYEVQLTQPDPTDAIFSSSADFQETISENELLNKNAIRMAEAKVKAKRPISPRRAWSGESDAARMDKIIFYDCDAITDRMYDKGEVPPNVYDWLRTKKYFNKQVFEKDNAAVWWADGVIVGQTNVRPSFNVSGGMIVPEEKDPAMWLDEIKTMYVSIDTVTLDQTSLQAWGPYPVFVRMFPHYTFLRKVKGLRRTHFQGYNIPQTFYMNDYSVMPPEEGYRRTLYWNPNVTTDKEGKATIEFWNNSTCRQFIISAEGITKDGTPAVYRGK